MRSLRSCCPVLESLSMPSSALCKSFMSSSAAMTKTQSIKIERVEDEACGLLDFQEPAVSVPPILLEGMACAIDW